MESPEWKQRTLTTLMDSILLGAVIFCYWQFMHVYNIQSIESSTITLPGKDPVSYRLGDLVPSKKEDATVYEFDMVLPHFYPRVLDWDIGQTLSKLWVNNQLVQSPRLPLARGPQLDRFKYLPLQHYLHGGVNHMKAIVVSTEKDSSYLRLQRSRLYDPFVMTAHAVAVLVIFWYGWRRFG